jgi:hypothetical protein
VQVRTAVLPSASRGWIVPLKTGAIMTDAEIASLRADIAALRTTVDNCNHSVNLLLEKIKVLYEDVSGLQSCMRGPQPASATVRQLPQGPAADAGLRQHDGEPPAPVKVGAAAQADVRGGALAGPRTTRLECRDRGLRGNGGADMKHNPIEASTTNNECSETNLTERVAENLAAKAARKDAVRKSYEEAFMKAYEEARKRL